MTAALCAKCQAAIVADLAGLSAEGELLCSACYLADPPAADVDGVFAEVAAHMEPPKKLRKPRAPRKTKAALLTELGQALGCSAKATKATAKPEAGSGLPEGCWYTGPLSELGPAEPRRPRIELSSTFMDREAHELAQQGREDLRRFFAMKAAFKLRKAARVSL